MSTQKNGLLTISLDFELHWGVFDKRNRAQREQCYRNTRALIPQMLDLFESHGVGVTWATVGSLFTANEEVWRAHWPDKLPGYVQQKYSAYAFAEAQGVGQDVAWAHFAPELVNLIASYPGQELATHTFAHYYCLEPGQQVEQFIADLRVVQQLATDMTGRHLTSLVFPRNQFNEAYLRACYEAGITVIRSNPSVWYWSGIANDDTSLLRRVFRTGDVFVPMGGRTTYPLSSLQPAEPGMPLCLPASRLLRQFDPRHPWLNRLRLQRVKTEMTYAARHNECYHLWWHPENFGETPEVCMQELRELLAHYTFLQKEWGMQSWCMRNYPSGA